LPTETATYCAKHPKEETVIRCASCDKPICPKCMVSTPVGMKCPDCGLSRGGVLFTVSPARFVLAGITAFTAGIIAAVIGEAGMFFLIFVSIAYGYFAGGMILKASGMKRGIKMEILAGSGMVIGALAFKLLPAIVFSANTARLGISLIAFGVSSLADPWLWLAVAISTACAVSKIRYI
jgi:hypothetical protein